MKPSPLGTGPIIISKHSDMAARISSLNITGAPNLAVDYSPTALHQVGTQVDRVMGRVAGWLKPFGGVWHLTRGVELPRRKQCKN